MKAEEEGSIECAITETGRAMLAFAEWHDGRYPEPFGYVNKVAWRASRLRAFQSWLAAWKATRFDFAAYLQRQAEWSLKTFGPEQRHKGVIDHIRKELVEIEADPTDGEEWIDVILLALDGARRAAKLRPEEIIATLVAKQTKNEGRAWPDWRTADPSKAIEHVDHERQVQDWSDPRLRVADNDRLDAAGYLRGPVSDGGMDPRERDMIEHGMSGVDWTKAPDPALTMSNDQSPVFEEDKPVEPGMSGFRCT